MLKHVRAGLIVWGAIITIISIITMAVMVSNDSEEAAYVAIPFLIGGIIMIVFGIINAVKVSKYNNEILSRNLVYMGNCPSCNTEIRATISDFKTHGRYPEGFMYCPVCKKPVSKNAFREIPMQVQNNY